MRHREAKSLPRVTETAEGLGVKGTGAELFGDGELREEGVLSGEAGGMVPAGRRQSVRREPHKSHIALSVGGGALPGSGQGAPLLPAWLTCSDQSSNRGSWLLPATEL